MELLGCNFYPLGLLDAVELAPDVRGVHEVPQVRHGVRGVIRASRLPVRQATPSEHHRLPADVGPLLMEHRNTVMI